MEVGQFVRWTKPNSGSSRVVKVVELLESQPTAIIETVVPVAIHHVPLTELTTLDHKDTPHTSYTQAESLTPKQQQKLKFNHDLFTETGVTISCKCGRVTRSIAPVYIRSWANENAALNYVLSLCATCRPSLPDFNNATQRYYGATNE